MGFVMKKFLLSAGVIGMTMMLVATDGISHQAMAGCAGCARETTLRKTNSILKDIRSAQNNTRKEVRESADRIIAALKLQTGEQSAHFDKQIEAQKRITDAAQQNDSVRLRQEFRAAAESGAQDPSPDLCIIAGLFKNGGSGTPAGAQAVGSAGSLSIRAETDGADPAVAQGGVALAKSIVDASLQYKGRMGSIDPTTDPRLLVEEPTSQAKDATDEAAIDRLARNMTNPFPDKPVSADQLSTPEGQALASAKKIQTLRAATSQELIAMVRNMREAKGPVNAQWQDRIDGISDYQSTVGDKISELQGLDIRTLYYYAPNAETLQKRQVMSEKALLQTLIDNVSIGNRLAYLNLQMNTRRGMVETQILSALMGQN